MIIVPPPQTAAELLERSALITGRLILDLVLELQVDPASIPINLLRAKGWFGKLLELYLGADANSAAAPDFQKLQIELKTLPLTPKLKPRETTYVCTLQASQLHLPWAQTWVRAKLAQVLWIPIIYLPDRPPAEYLLGRPFLSSLSQEQERVLADDWLEIQAWFNAGKIIELPASIGTYLHVRPKAASAKELISTAAASDFLMTPKGLYLRPKFTASLFASQLKH